MAVLVSACLLGICCRYDGKTKPNEKVMALAESGILIPICPEQLGGRPTPRNPVEISNGKRTISVTAGESDVVVNNINMTLSEKVYLKDGVMYAPYDFADLLK